MRKKSTTKITDPPEIQWKRRQSEIRGYQKTFYINTDDRDYLRVDYNLKEKRVRLYVEISREGGTAYFAVVTAGRITVERNAINGRSVGVSEKISARAHIFSTISNNEVLKLINKHYGIGKVDSESVKVEREKRKEETKKRYFKGQYEEGAGGEYADTGFSRIRWADGADLLAGALIVAGVFWYYDYSYPAAGIAASVFGIAIGFFDMFFRDRSPVFTKVFLFVLGGIGAYFYGYFL
jgi:hypothetical protein